MSDFHNLDVGFLQVGWHLQASVKLSTCQPRSHCFSITFYFLQSFWVQYFASNHMSSQGAIYLRHLPWHFNDIRVQYRVLLELHITQRQLESPRRQNAAQFTIIWNKELCYCNTTRTQCVPTFLSFCYCGGLAHEVQEKRATDAKYTDDNFL